ncbi:unnamed protein product [Notodromas monacha]|uniref:Uncharacterized protein n=1 Tax=Notodromas monacha TaxID=399045 RepID=A0A7R9BSG9_9CRUS|nr:unnamed protein product [Notodromas monacha]CAG0919490.1 unnamed protein product [Notodromas monacha]
MECASHESLPTHGPEQKMKISLKSRVFQRRRGGGCPGKKSQRFSGHRALNPNEPDEFSDWEDITDALKKHSKLEYKQELTESHDPSTCNASEKTKSEHSTNAVTRDTQAGYATKNITAYSATAGQEDRDNGHHREDSRPGSSNGEEKTVGGVDHQASNDDLQSLLLTGDTGNSVKLFRGLWSNFRPMKDKEEHSFTDMDDESNARRDDSMCAEKQEGRAKCTAASLISVSHCVLAENALTALNISPDEERIARDSGITQADSESTEKASPDILDSTRVTDQLPLESHTSEPKILLIRPVAGENRASSSPTSDDATSEGFRDPIMSWDELLRSDAGAKGSPYYCPKSKAMHKTPSSGSVDHEKASTAKSADDTQIDCCATNTGRQFPPNEKQGSCKASDAEPEEECSEEQQEEDAVDTSSNASKLYLKAKYMLQRLAGLKRENLYLSEDMQEWSEAMKGDSWKDMIFLRLKSAGRSAFPEGPPRDAFSTDTVEAISYKTVLNMSALAQMEEEIENKKLRKAIVTSQQETLLRRREKRTSDVAMLEDAYSYYYDVHVTGRKLKKELEDSFERFEKKLIQVVGLLKKFPASWEEKKELQLAAESMGEYLSSGFPLDPGNMKILEILNPHLKEHNLLNVFLQRSGSSKISDSNQLWSAYKRAKPKRNVVPQLMPKEHAQVVTALPMVQREWHRASLRSAIQIKDGLQAIRECVRNIKNLTGKVSEPKTFREAFWDSSFVHR